MNNRIKLLVLLTTLSMGVFAQKTFQSDVEIIKEYDEFTKTATISPNKISSYLDMQGDKRFFALMPMIEKGEFAYLGVSIHGLGCIDNAVIYIMLESGDVITKTMFNKFNCDNIAGFRLSKKEWDKLSTEKIDKVKVYNRGRDIVSSPDFDDYFIKLAYLLENKDY